MKNFIDRRLPGIVILQHNTFRVAHANDMETLQHARLKLSHLFSSKIRANWKLCFLRGHWSGLNVNWGAKWNENFSFFPFYDLWFHFPPPTKRKTFFKPNFHFTSPGDHAKLAKNCSQFCQCGKFVKILLNNSSSYRTKRNVHQQCCFIILKMLLVSQILRYFHLLWTKWWRWEGS